MIIDHSVGGLVLTVTGHDAQYWFPPNLSWTLHFPELPLHVKVLPIAGTWASCSSESSWVACMAKTWLKQRRAKRSFKNISYLYNFKSKPLEFNK